jgi:hypothetical protein
MCDIELRYLSKATLALTPTSREIERRVCDIGNNMSVLGNHFSKMKHVIINAICRYVCFFSFVAYPFFQRHIYI